MDAMAVATAIFSALTLVITLQGFVQAQDSLCPLEPVVIHLSRGQKVTISYHVNHGVEQDIVQVPKVTRRPFGPSRIPSTTTGPLVTDDLDPYEGNGTRTTRPSTATPDLKDASNVTLTTTADVSTTTFESHNETEITSHVLSTASVDYSPLANETGQGNETVTVITELSSPNVLVGVVSTTLEVQSSTLPSSTVKNEELLTTISESGLDSYSVGNREELTTVNAVEVQTTTENHVVTTVEVSSLSTEEVRNENSTTEASTASNLTVQSSDSTTQTLIEKAQNENATSESVENENTTTKSVENENSTTESIENENSTSKSVENENSTTESIENENSTSKSVENENSTTESVENENSSSKSVENENSTTAGHVQNENSTTDQVQYIDSATKQVQNENSTTEAVENNNSTSEAIFTSELTTESDVTSSVANVEVKDELDDEDKAEEVTDEPLVSDKPVDTEIDEDFGGEVEDESENNDTSTSSVIKSIETSPVSTTLITSPASVDEENQTSVNDSFLNVASQLDSNVTTIREDEISTTTQSQKRKLVPISVDDDDDDSPSVTLAQQTTEITDLPLLPLSESDQSLLANLTSITQQESTESTAVVNQDDEEIELNVTHVNATTIDGDLDDEEIILNSTNVNVTTTNEDDEFDDENENEDEKHDHEEETLLQPILDQILANNVTDESRDGRVVDSSNSTSSEVDEEPQYDEETDDEEKDTEEEVAHADDTHSYADGEDLGPDIVKREAEKLRSERWRRTLRYHVQPNVTLCEWHFKTDPGVPLLLSFKNYSIPISERCEDHHIAVRRSNGYVARWCGKAKETPSHTTFARQELHLLLYSENGPAETGFVAEIQALDTFLLRKAVHKVRPLFSQTSARH